MNFKKKIHQESPLTKCRTKRISSLQKKTIKGTFVATVNIGDVCDETSSAVQSGASWITETESIKSQETVDDVFDATTLIIPENQNDEWSLSHIREDSITSTEKAKEDAEEEIASPETLRRSENQNDEWSLSHLGEDSITSTERGAEDDVLSTPERCRSPHSAKTPKRSISPLKIITPAIDPILPNIEEMEEPLSMELYDKDNAEMEYRHGTKKSKLSQKRSQKQYERIFHSTRIGTPETISSPHFEMLDDISSISCSIKSKTKHESRQKSTTLKENINFQELSEMQFFLKTKRKDPSQMQKFKKVAPEEHSFKALPVSHKEPKTLHSATLIPSGKCMEVLVQAKKKADLSLQQALSVSSKKPKTLDSATSIPSGKCMEALVQAKKKTDLSFQQSQQITIKNHKTLHSVTLIPSDKSMEALCQAKSTDLCVTPRGPRAKKIFKRKILLDQSLRPKTGKEDILPKLKSQNEMKLNESAYLAQKSSHTTIKHSQECVNIAKSGEITRSPSLRNSKENAVEIVEETDTNDSDQSKKIAATKDKKKSLLEEKAREDVSKERSLSAMISEAAVQDLNLPSESVDSWSKAIAVKQPHKNLKFKLADVGASHSKTTSAIKVMKKKLHKRKPKNSLLEEYSFSTVKSSLPIKNFVVSTEFENSTIIHSQRTSESNSNKFLKGAIVNDSLKIAASRRQKVKERLEARITNESSQEEIISTPSSTTISEDTAEYVDDTTSRETTSEGSTEKFLEEMGLYESSTETESTKTKEERKKRKEQDDLWDQKSLSEKLKEYKEYLNTLPICDLSLKKWRDKKEKYKY